LHKQSVCKLSVTTLVGFRSADHALRISVHWRISSELAHL